MIIATITGRLGADPETKETRAGNVTELRIASTPSRDREHTDWVRCTFWGKHGDVIAQYKRKGDWMSVTGELTHREWTDKDGATRLSPEINATHHDFGPKTTEAKPAGNRGGYGGGQGGYKGGGYKAPQDDSSDIPF